ncbi:CoA-binding protein [Dokdonia genika]|uniref:CoA-binding protein n=1 Tax=Dokdonia genika TaxID=308113 RepID=A0ABV9LC55_9FLAO
MLKTTMVIGASLKPQRYSHRAIIRLNAQNHPVIAVGLRGGKVGDIGIITFDQAIETVEELKEDLDTITLYLNPQRQEAYYDFIINLAPKRVIFNPGTENPVLYKMLQAHNIEVDVACTLVLLGTDQY